MVASHVMLARDGAAAARARCWLATSSMSPKAMFAIARSEEVNVTPVERSNGHGRSRRTGNMMTAYSLPE